LNLELITTRDGSHSLYRPDLDETYHSVFGAIQESMHIFISNGLMAADKKCIQIFEMGFGTGLNALLTWIESVEKQMEVKYYSIEKYPIDSALAAQLNYPSFLSQESSGIFKAMHYSEWEVDINLGHLILHKIHADILDYDVHPGNDLVYFDAFSPDKEPLLWSEKILHKIYDSMSDGGIFVTYSVKGEVRRMLLSTGFRVEKLPGPQGKKHILRAFK
jgi:tRNA U34 5-methylaminomethyl-2-thiouridine-forming methyltransferase MnmC